MRLSQTDENSQGASNHQPPPSDRPEKTLCLKKRFPRHLRLHTRAQFRYVQREGTRFEGVALTFRFVIKNFNSPVLGITVSKQFGNAVCRNGFKRKVKEIFRLQQHLLPAGLVLHINPRSKSPTFQQMENDFYLFLYEPLLAVVKK